MTEDPYEAPARHSVESVTHWRTLRESFERRIRRLETDLRDFRWEPSPGLAGPSADRRHERLLRLRRLHAKLVSRERLAADEASPAP